MRTSEIEAAAALLWDLWQHGEQVEQLPEGLRPASLEEGWAIQRAVDGLAGPAAGWKFAATSPSGQALIGVDRPLLGVLYASTLLDDGAIVAATHMGVVEAEFAFRMARDLWCGDAPFTREAVVASIGAAVAGIEVPETRLSAFPATGAAQMVADVMCARWYVVGPELPVALVELPSTELVLTRNGVVEDRRTGADILGDPVDALVLLANLLAEQGCSLRAGDVVTTGGCAVINGVRGGDVITATYGGTTSVSVRVA